MYIFALLICIYCTQVGGLNDVFVMEMGKNPQPERVSEDNLMKWAEMNSALKKDTHVSTPKYIRI